MQGLTLQATYTIPVWNTLNVHTTTNVKIVNSIAERMTMINEICKLHSKLDFNTEILINMSRYDYQTKIQKADKEDYIKALEATREKDDLSIFRRFMSEMMEKQLEREIAEFKQSVGEDEDGVLSMNTTKKKLSTKERILERLQMDNTLTASALAIEFGLSLGAINKQITLLKREGKLLRIGPPKGGYWEIP